MKRLILLLLLALPVITHAQGEALIVSSSNVSFDSAAAFTVSQMLQYNPYDTTEGGDFTAFNRWARFYRNRVPLDAPANVNIMEELSTALFYYMNNLDLYCSSNPNIYTGNWSLLGPNNDYYGQHERQGRIDAIWVDPNDMGYILAGANMGGLWKSTDTGHTWVNITDPSPTNNSVIPGTMGAQRIAVNPLDRDTIYISLGIMGTLRKHAGYAMGLMYTHDGGQTWNYDNAFINANQKTDIAYYEKWVRQVKYMPGTGELFAISNNKVLHKPAGILGWYDITPSGLGTGYLFTDIEFSKQNPGKLIVSTNAKNNISSLWVIDMTVSTPTWQELQITLPSPYFQLDEDLIIDVSISGTDIAYLNIEGRNVSDSTLAMILVSTPINTVNLNLINTSFNRGQFAYEFIEVSEANEDVIYAAIHDQSTSFYRSVDGGVSFTTMQGSTHADARCLLVYHTDTGANGINDIVFGGSDGGVVMKRDSSLVFESITGSGLAITQFYGLSNTEANENIAIGGTQDNGGIAYMRDAAMPWQGVYGGDNFMTKFANNGVTQAYTEGNPMAPIARINFNTTTNQASHISSVGNPNDFGNPDPRCQYCEQNNMQRPLYFDPDNDAFIGYLDVWTQSFAGTTWTRAFNASFPEAWGKTRSFAVREPNKDTVYIAYEDRANGNPTSPNDSIGKLFRSDNANSTNPLPSWTNITPSHIQWAGITSLVTDPRTMKRLWISLGNVNYGTSSYSPANSTHRVLYNGNYGDANSWVDISRGLPPVPVNKLLYLEGSDDILFAGTDAGVFRWNKTDSTWYCFNTGLPPCVVNDMEFNYCAGKLRIATFGRGIWESPAFDNSYVSNPSNIISSNTTWASTRYLKSGVKVTNGATLTIQNTGQVQTVIYMPKNGSIIVEPGAQLVVNGARITNGCEDCMWNGIRLVGQTNQPQGANLQGTLVLSNGAVIEHAKIGVANYGPDTPTFNNTGGIIEAVDATFLNNACAVSLQDYRYQPAWSPLLSNYKARFSECDFIINDDFKSGAGNKFLSHVQMHEVDGVRFNSCGFYNWNTSATYNDEGDGIRAGNSGFTVSVCGGLPMACTPYKRTRFAGLRTGVWAEYDNLSGPQHGVLVDQSNFDSCSVGIRVRGQHAFVATRDTFRMGYGKTAFIDEYDCYKNVGIWTEQSHGSYIEGSHFEGFTHGGQAALHENIGTIVDNSSASNKQIYRNTFTNLHKASYARGVNRDGYAYGSIISSGLRYCCNIYDGNEYDILTNKMAMHTSNTVQGIAYYQGSLAQSAGNQFLDRTSTNHIINLANGLLGYYHTTGNYVPIYHPILNYWSAFSVPTAHACVATIAANDASGGGINFPVSATTLSGIKMGFFLVRDNKETLEGTLAGSIDGGNTAALISYINGSTKADSPTVRTTLLGYSPYVSIEALTALADADILPTTGLMQVLKANPEMLLDETLLEHLETGIPNPLTGAEILELRTASETPSALSAALSTISDYAMEMDWSADMILMHYLLDTTADDRDSIVVWLDNKNTMRSMYLKAAFYTGEGDYTTAQAILEDIPEQYTLTSDEQTEYELYMEAWELVKSVREDDRLLSQLTEEEIGELDAIRDNPLATGRLIGTTIDVITNVPRPNYRLPCNIGYGDVGDKPGRRTEQEQMRKQHRQAVMGKNNFVKAYPNPAKDFVVFEYKLRQSGGMTLHITNTTGQKVAEVKLDGSNGKTEWQTQSVPAGVYIYELKNGNISVDVGRIVITK